MKIVYLFMAVSLLLNLSLPASAEEITLSTYYPAPYGEYNEITAHWIDVNDPQADAGEGGRDIRIKAQDGGTGADSNGGNILLLPGAANASGKPGGVGINTTDTEFSLTIDKGSANPDGGILSMGTYGAGRDLSTSGPGTRFIWYPKKAALRAGRVTNDAWDDGNIGDYSVAIGSSTRASNEASIAIGYNLNSSGIGSIALGNTSIASGDYSMALGKTAQALGDNSVAMGEDSIASGSHSFTFGQGMTAAGDYSFGIALNNQAGTTISQPNTMAIMGGNVGIGTTSPKSVLHVVSTTSGFIPPKMTVAQRDSINAGTPPEGSLVYVTVDNAGDPVDELQCYNGSEWKYVAGGTEGRPWTYDNINTYNVSVTAGSPWEELDLSGLIGNQRAVVFLKIAYTNLIDPPSPISLSLKPYTSTSQYDESVISGANVVKLVTQGQYCTALAITDIDGKLGLNSDLDNTFSIKVISYAAAA